MFAPSVGTVKNGEHAFATSGGTAWRRRQRRLRAFRRFVLWHSKMEVAAALHHSSGLRTSTAALRVVGSLPPAEEFSRPVFGHVHQEQSAAGEMPENMVEFPDVQEQVLVQAVPRVVGSLPPVQEITAYVARRPSPLVEVRPSVRAQRHVVEQLADIAPMVQILDSPVPQTSEQLLEVFWLLDTQMPVELAIAVPKISLDRIPQRSFVLTPQSAEQLVEVPTVLTPTRIALQIAEQIVDTPVPRGRVHGSLPGQSSSSRRGDERAEVPKIRLLLRTGGRTVRGTRCRRRSRCVSSSGRIAGAWVFRSHRSASTVMDSSRLTTHHRSSWARRWRRHRG